MSDVRPTLFDLINNSLVLHQLAPYLALPQKLALAATCRRYKQCLFEAPETFRYLDLSNIKAARLQDSTPIDLGGISWRAERVDEHLTEDEFYAGPLRGIFANFERLGVLKYIQTLILDTLSCPADLVQEIMTDCRFNVRMLSIRQAVHLNERRLMQILEYSCRPTRPKGTPRVKAIYLFGKAGTYNVGSPTRAIGDSKAEKFDGGVMSSEGAQIGAEWTHRSFSALSAALHVCEDRWYQPSGHVIERTFASKWGATLQVCKGLVALDAVLCRGPLHDTERLATQTPDTPQTERWIEAAIANIALGPSGCVRCGASTEEPAVFRSSPSSHLPLLSPPPLHSSSVDSAQMPSLKIGSAYPPFFARCEDCLRGRWCERCFRWWDERCYTNSQAGGSISAEVSFETMRRGTLPLADGGLLVHMDLCIDQCLVREMMSGSGSSGMWG